MDMWIWVLCDDDKKLCLFCIQSVTVRKIKIKEQINKYL